MNPMNYRERPIYLFCKWRDVTLAKTAERDKLGGLWESKNLVFWLMEKRKNQTCPIVGGEKCFFSLPKGLPPF
jgi:hypothetical protein